MRFLKALLLLAILSQIAQAKPCVLHIHSLPSDSVWNQGKIISLDKQHQQGLAQIVKDLSNLNNPLQTSSYSEIENHPRITISGDWNTTCLVNLMTLIQNQGLNRKLINEGGFTTTKMMLDLVDPFLAPFSTLKRFLTSEAIEKIILDAIGSDDPEGRLKEKLEEMAEANGAELPSGKEGDRFMKQMEQLMEMYQLAQENSRLPKDAKWNSWDFDPGRSTLDDFIPDLISPPDRIIPSQAMARFGMVDAEDSPVEDNSDGKGLTVQRVVMKGVAEKGYPANSPCSGQILDYEITINNYGHVDSKGNFVSDYIDYEIELNCCDKDEDANYEEENEPIVYVPREDYKLALGGNLGYGNTEGDNLFCAGARAQYFPDVYIGPCGSRPVAGLDLNYDYQGFSDESYSFRQQSIVAIPSIQLLTPVIPDLYWANGINLPLSTGKSVSESSFQTNETQISSIGLGLNTGLFLQLSDWQVQLQTDILGWSRQKFTDPDNPNSSSASSNKFVNINKENSLKLAVMRTF
jgi:hypothetical protein